MYTLPVVCEYYLTTIIRHSDSYYYDYSSYQLPPDALTLLRAEGLRQRSS